MSMELEVVGYCDPRNVQKMKSLDVCGFMVHDEPSMAISAPVILLSDAQRLLAQRDAEVERLRDKRRVASEQYEATIRALESQQAASLDAAAERNAMQRQRDDAKKLLVRECDDADELVRLLGLDPEAVRTDGGFLNLAAVRSMLAASVGGEREAFEAWATHILTERQPLRPELYWPTTQTAWEAWQARAALSPAGGGVVMPERKQRTAGWSFSPMVDDGWNACLDEFARLNAKPSDAPELLANSQEGE